MADKGFLEQLGVGSIDERAMVREQRLSAKDVGLRLGMGARRGLGAAVGGIGGLLSGQNYSGNDESGRSFMGFLQNVAAGAQGYEDYDAAMAAGISVEDLYARRGIRKELGSTPRAEGEDIYDYRERVAARAAEIAAASGSARQEAAALDALKAVRDEKIEYQKQLASQDKTQQDLLKSGIMTGYSASGDPLTGRVGTDTLPDGKVAHGLWYSQGGEMKFRAWNDEFTAEDPTKADSQKETVDQRFRKAFGKNAVEETRSMVQANAGTLRKISRVAANMRDLTESGMADQVISDSGKWVSTVDNVVKNISGFVSSFLGPRDFKPGENMRERYQYGLDKAKDPEGRFAGRNGDSWSGLSTWYGRALDPNDSMWSKFQLPAYAQGVSQAAQEHRAQILELAYMAARLAEPSNRGLSDKDIEAALARISGDTSNPQQIMNRFMTIVYDAGMELEDKLQSYYSAIRISDDPQENRDEIDRYFGGELITSYRKDRGKLYEDFGVRIDQYGRPIFDDVLGATVNPETNSVQTPSTPAQLPEVETMTPEEKRLTLDKILRPDTGNAP